MFFLIKKIRRIKVRINKRYKPFYTRYLGFKCLALDKLAFLFMADEIFLREVYNFKSKNETPYIIDCGANIGLSVIYFKNIYPRARIIAFEPYKLAIEAFKYNTKKFVDVKLIEKALFSTVGEVDFYPEGSDGSRIALKGDLETHKVSTELLSTYLNQNVDFLKIDIEGSEVDVIMECGDKLQNVQNMYVEYHAHESKQNELIRLISVIEKSGFKYYIEADGIRSKSPFIKIESRLGYIMLVSIFCYR